MRFSDNYLSKRQAGRILANIYIFIYLYIYIFIMIIMIMDIGTNDLAAGIPPLIVAVEIIKFFEKVLKSQSNLHVMVCSVIPRSSRLNSSESNFKLNIVNCNTYLRNMCSVNSSIHYWKHKGFWADPVSYWSRDGIHPNSRIGRKRYCTSIKNGIFMAVQYSRY